jgi:hypothetical protein
MAGIEPFRSEPRVDDQDATRRDVPCHRGDGRSQRLGRLDVADAAEQARHDVERPAEVEVAHVGGADRHVRHLARRDGHQALIEVDALDLVPRPQVLEVPPGAARDVEQGPGVRYARRHELADPRGLARVVLPVVEQVVELGRIGEHRSDWSPGIRGLSSGESNYEDGRTAGSRRDPE